MSIHKCHYCATTSAELRPYGPKGAWVCFPCATTPEREVQTKAEFGRQLNAAGSVAVIGDGDVGPIPIEHSSIRTNQPLPTDDERGEVE